MVATSTIGSAAPDADAATGRARGHGDPDPGPAPGSGAHDVLSDHAAADDPDPCPRARIRDRMAALSDDELAAEVVALAKRLSVGTYDLLVLIGEFDVRGGWAESGALSCVSWLVDSCGTDAGTARRQVNVARAMRRFPELDEAMANGDVPYSRARVIVGQLSEDNVADLVEIACTTPSGRLGRAVAAWCMRNEDPEVIRRRQHEARSMGWGTAADGMIDFHARLAPPEAAVVCAVIETRVARRQNVPAGTSLRQQRADALVTICTGEEDSDSGDAQVLVHVRGEGNTTRDGTPLSDTAVREMLDYAHVSLLLYDVDGRPVDASPRHRLSRHRPARAGPG